MNILVVCRTLPYPPDSMVKIRLFNLVRYLSDKHSISLVCYVDSGNQENHLNKIKEYCESIILVHRTRKSKIKQLPSVVKNLFLGLPWNIKYAKTKEMQNAIDQIVKSKFIDVIHIDDIYMASNVALVSRGNTKKAVTFLDIDSVRFRRSMKIEKNPYEKLRNILNWLTIKRWESRIATNFELSIVVSSIDRRLLKSNSMKANIAVILNGVDTDSLKPLPPSEHKNNILFIGNMGYSPNRDGAVYFAKQIFPIIKSRMPKAKFWIVGKNSNEELKRLSRDPNVNVTGYVESVIPYYERCSVVVVPLRAGGGTRGKILEAMALGRPVVSTSLGAEGLEVTHKENIMIADRPEDFATITLELMRNRSLVSGLVDNARKFVESKHSWRKIADNLDQKYKEICTRPYNHVP